MRKALTYGAGLIAIYLVTVRATGAGTIIKSGTAGASNVIKTFQGR